MGTWGGGLYADDLASDLRSTLGALVRVPLDGDGLVEALVALDPEAATDPDHDEHTVFWLVVADQLHKRGIASPRAFAEAVRILDSGADMERLRSLDADPRLRREREKVLAELGARLRGPLPQKKRNTLKKPQAHLYSVGTALCWPVDAHGRCINPYMGDRAANRFEPAGYVLGVVYDVGWAFDTLAWTALAVDAQPRPAPPTLADFEVSRCAPRPAGTLSAVHARRLEIVALGRVPVDLGPAPYGFQAAIHDISISNHMGRL